MFTIQEEEDHAARQRGSDGEGGRDNQHRKGGDVAGIDAVRMGKREQHITLGERFYDDQPDGDDGQHKRQDSAPAAAARRSQQHAVDCIGRLH
jgi:hypothetical protein